MRPTLAVAPECVYHAAVWFNLIYLMRIPAGFDMSSKGQAWGSKSISNKN
jgi:hypothetical protein